MARPLSCPAPVRTGPTPTRQLGGSIPWLSVTIPRIATTMPTSSTVGSSSGVVCSTLAKTTRTPTDEGHDDAAADPAVAEAHRGLTPAPSDAWIAPRASSADSRRDSSMSWSENRASR